MRVAMSSVAQQQQQLLQRHDADVSRALEQGAGGRMAQHPLAVPRVCSSTRTTAVADEARCNSPPWRRPSPLPKVSRAAANRCQRRPGLAALRHARRRAAVRRRCSRHSGRGQGLPTALEIINPSPSARSSPVRIHACRHAASPSRSGPVLRRPAARCVVPCRRFELKAPECGRGMLAWTSV